MWEYLLSTLPDWIRFAVGPGRWCAVSDLDEEDRYIDTKYMADSSALLVLKFKKKEKKRSFMFDIEFQESRVL